jgi:integration host factor subunit alpha
MNALTKAQMADRLFEELGLNKREAKEVVELFFEEVRASLERNEQVKLSGFGNFDLRDKGQRPGRNPKTGEEIPITARRVVTFRPGQKLKARRGICWTPARITNFPIPGKRSSRSAKLPAVRRKAARVALLGTGVPTAEASEAPWQSPVPKTGRHCDSAAAVRPGFHDRRGPPTPQATTPRGSDSVPAVDGQMIWNSKTYYAC